MLKYRKWIVNKKCIKGNIVQIGPKIIRHNRRRIILIIKAINKRTLKGA